MLCICTNIVPFAVGVTMPAAGPHSMIGQTLTGRYLVSAKLGEGGMGSVSTLR